MKNCRRLVDQLSLPKNDIRSEEKNGAKVATAKYKNL